MFWYGIRLTFVDLEELVGDELKVIIQTEAKREFGTRTLWFRLNKTSSTQTAGGRSMRRSSANVSGRRKPRPSRTRILLSVFSLFPYSGARSTYEDVSL